VTNETARPLLLVADDDAAARSSLAEALQIEGYEVMGVPNAAVALQKIRGGGRRPDLILLDLRMPVLNGWEFLAIREGDPVLQLIPVIALSGEDDPPSGIGREAFLAKPVDLARLKKMIARVLEESRPDPQRLPRRTEPWSVAGNKPNVIRNAFGHVVSYVASEQQARRIVAAVNATSRISTEALEAGIIDKGLDCLYQLHRYETEPDFQKDLDARVGRDGIVARRAEIATMLAGMIPDSRKPS
jgi:CheY-like chemotaxis protein